VTRLEVVYKQTTNLSVFTFLHINLTTAHEPVHTKEATHGPSYVKTEPQYCARDNRRWHLDHVCVERRRPSRLWWLILFDQHSLSYFLEFVVIRPHSNCLIKGTNYVADYVKSRSEGCACFDRRWHLDYVCIERRRPSRLRRLAVTAVDRTSVKEQDFL
jgi:hypothetical protein